MRTRSPSIVLKEVSDKSHEEALDRSAYVNINANWVNVKGALLLHPRTTAHQLIPLLF
jgi:hypothetical protein